MYTFSESSEWYRHETGESDEVRQRHQGFRQQEEADGGRQQGAWGNNGTGKKKKKKGFEHQNLCSPSTDINNCVSNILAKHFGETWQEDK